MHTHACKLIPRVGFISLKQGSEQVRLTLIIWFQWTSWWTHFHLILFGCKTFNEIIPYHIIRVTCTLLLILSTKHLFNPVCLLFTHGIVNTNARLLLIQVTYFHWRLLKEVIVGLSLLFFANKWCSRSIIEVHEPFLHLERVVVDSLIDIYPGGFSVRCERHFRGLRDAQLGHS